MAVQFVDVGCTINHRGLKFLFFMQSKSISFLLQFFKMHY